MPDKTAKKAPAAEPEQHWYAVRTDNGTHSYLAASEKDAQAMHERTVPADHILEVTEQT